MKYYNLQYADNIFFVLCSNEMYSNTVINSVLGGHNNPQSAYNLNIEPMFRLETAV